MSEPQTARFTNKLAEVTQENSAHPECDAEAHKKHIFGGHVKEIMETLQVVLRWLSPNTDCCPPMPSRSPLQILADAPPMPSCEECYFRVDTSGGAGSVAYSYKFPH